MKFREAVINDIEKLLELEQQVVEAERPFNPEIKNGKPIYYDMHKLLLDDNSCLLIAEDNGEIVATGYTQIQKSKQSLQHKKHAYLGFMYVSLDYRGQGLNQKIMQKLIQWSKSQGIKNHYLEVYSGNEPAIRAYGKVGFEPCLIEMKLNTD